MLLVRNRREISSEAQGETQQTIIGKRIGRTDGYTGFACAKEEVWYQSAVGENDAGRWQERQGVSTAKRRRRDPA